MPRVLALAPPGPQELAGSPTSSLCEDDGVGEHDGFGARLSNPTLHFDCVFEQKPLRASVGLGVAIPTSDSELEDIDDELAGRLGEVSGVYSRAMWNPWWYAPDAWTLFVPGSIDIITSEHEFGFEGALGVFGDGGDVWSGRLSAGASF